MASCCEFSMSMRPCSSDSCGVTPSGYTSSIGTTDWLGSNQAAPISNQFGGSCRSPLTETVSMSSEPLVG